MAEKSFFDYAAYVGLTKHLGGVSATDKIIRRCQINKTSYVLDVGCGAGVTPCYIAREIGCRVVGVDIVPAMIERANEEARRNRVEHLVQFRTGDALDLPFDPGTFDVLFTESVTAITGDAQKALNEYVRVLQPGGYVGLNESTTLKSPPPPDVIAWASQDLGATVTLITRDEWIQLMENAGLVEIEAEVFNISTQEETRAIMQRYGLSRMLRVLTRTLKLYLKDPSYRKFVRSVRDQGIAPSNLIEYFGYGLYVGVKKGRI
jgi:ubiquinone/menaquinone biosynthesis C-methylase UbiE